MAKAQAADVAAERRYYVLDVRTDGEGAVRWWLPDRSGVTTDLDAAGIFGARAARDRRAWPAGGCPVPVGLARRAATTQVDWAQLRALADREGLALPQGERAR